MNEFVVRPYAAQDRARLLDLLRTVWPTRRPLEPHVDRRWWWQFSEPPVLLVESARTGTLVGLCAYLPFRLRTRDGERDAAWFVDFYVLPDHQGRGLGRTLTEAVQARVTVTASLSQTAMAWRVFQKLRWRPRAPVQMRMHPWPKPWMFPRPSGYDVTSYPLDSKLPVKAELDGLWSEVSSAYSAIASRTGEDIARRYASSGGRAYEIVCVRREGTIAGYMVVRTPGLIVDVLARPDDAGAFGAMLSESSRRLIELGATRLYCLVTPAAWRRVLGRHGFLAADTPLIGARLRSQTKWLTCFAADPTVPDPPDWFVTLGDCDLDLAWAGGSAAHA